MDCRPVSRVRPDECVLGHRFIVARVCAPRGTGRRAIPGPSCDDHRVRAIATRVSSASVTVDGEVVGRIDRPGLLVLVGATHTDTLDTARGLAGKLFELRILHGDESCATAAAPLLVVSQFTLYARTDKGRRPSWNLAAPGDQAEPLVRELVDELRRRGAAVQTGVFGAMMQVASVNDGPFTVIVDV
jgi:D-tyrosyl-tRNA(Tyr) deacylase